MQTLIIPDVHEQTSKLERILDKYESSVDRVVFLGDFFDSFRWVDWQEMIQWLASKLGNPKYTFLLGNHDAHYIFRNPNFECSGFDTNHYWMIRSHFPALDTMCWGEISTKVGKYLLSHAGYHPSTIADREQEESALVMALDGDFHSLFGAGRARGGSYEVGGPIWLDWDQEFEDIEDVPQIVGHSQHKQPQQKGASWCLDTGLNHIGLVQDDKDLEIIDVQAL